MAEQEREAEIQAELIIGRLGRLISASKSRYLDANPGNLVAFNANLCTKEHGKIWFGDIDVTKDKEKIELLADELKVSIYVLREMDGRFENTSKPLYDRAIYIAGAKYGNV